MFAKRGTDGSIRDLGISVETYADAGFSYSFPLLDDKLYIGAKAKVLVMLRRASDVGTDASNSVTSRPSRG